MANKAYPEQCPALQDTYHGDDASLVSSIKSLLNLDAAGALVPHGVGGHARVLLSAAAVRLASRNAAGSGISDEAIQALVTKQHDVYLTARSVRKLLADALAMALVTTQPSPERDVTKIMLGITPGEDGMGHEVYAESVADVEAMLSRVGQELEEWQLGIRRLEPATTQAQEAAQVANIFSTLRYVLGAPPGEGTPSQHYGALLDRIASWPLVGADALKSAASLRAREAMTTAAPTAPPSVPGDEAQVLASLRADGWTVAVHNDYRLNGVAHTFWLFTKGDACLKGEGRTDLDALRQIDALRAARQAQDKKP